MEENNDQEGGLTEGDLEGVALKGEEHQEIIRSWKYKKGKQAVVAAAASASQTQHRPLH